ncbi:hypothetical protein ACFQQB_35765 [Nonomuraea rubra]|uniref:hypothetical protein n=1 Tax=Nonomuraea rubra TaxID=46180 RepID=UPI003623794A
MNSELYLSDLESKPEHLAALADALRAGDPFQELPARRIDRVLFLGMGSSRYAAGVAALRLRTAGVNAHAEYASAAASLPNAEGTLVVPISATGTSRRPSTPWPGTRAAPPTWRPSPTSPPPRWPRPPTWWPTCARARSAAVSRAGRSSTRWPCCWPWSPG